MDKIKTLQLKATQIRKDLLQIIYEGKTGHTGGALSSTDILVSLFYHKMKFNVKNPKWEDRDRFVLSKGHSVEGYYCVLADLGFFPKEELLTFSKFKSRLIGHPNVKVPGVEMNTGALGHGLSAAVGMALGGKMNKKDYKVYVLMGDGELAEGSVWEGAMAAGHYKVDNLIGIVDRNGLQISGRTEDVMRLENLEDKWKSFGWEVIVIDGNDMSQLVETLDKIPEHSSKPHMIIAKTVKGKGVPFMENVAKWHHGVPNEEQLETAFKTLENLAKELAAND